MPSFSTLSLGTRKDAARWRKGMKEKLTFAEGVYHAEPSPTLAAIEGFFGRSDDWLFLAGHYDQDVLYNEQQTIKIKFQSSKVEIAHGSQSKTLIKGQRMKQAPKLVLWGGCSVCDSTQSINMLRTLFGGMLLIGWKGQTGWEIVDIMLGGFGHANPTGPWNSPNFFDKLGNGAGDLKKCRDAWLDVAKSIPWGPPKPGEPPYIERFCVVDPDGTVHSLPPQPAGETGA